MKFIAIIPARYASTRFPGKPLAMIGSLPMIQHVYDNVARVFDHCCVATDDRRILEAAREFGAPAVMTSDTHRSGTDRCAEALGKAEELWGTHFDVVVNVQGDEPFVAQEQLDKIRALFADSRTQIATLVKAFAPGEDIFNPNTPKVVVSRDGYAIYFSRSPIPYLRGVPQADWQANHKYYKHIGLYAYRTATLREITRLAPGELEAAESLEQLRWLENGYRIRVAETSSESAAVDTPEDLERVIRECEAR